MDKRFFLALLLTAIVIIAPPLIFQRGGVQRTTSGIDTSRTPNRGDTTTKQASAPGAATPNAGTSVAQPQNVPVAQAPIETTTVETRLARYRFTSQGAVPISVALDSYPSRRPGATNTTAQLLPAKAALAHLRLALGPDTIALDTISLRGQSTSGATGYRGAWPPGFPHSFCPSPAISSPSPTTPRDPERDSVWTRTGWTPAAPAGPCPHCWTHPGTRLRNCAGRCDRAVRRKRREG